MTLLAVHAGTTCFLAGLSWVVLVVVYPAFRLVGPTPGWPAYHAAHSRRMGQVVALPWAVQGVAMALLLLRDPSPLAFACGALDALPVLVTVLVSVPCHESLSTYDDGLVDRLQRSHRWRTAAWTAGAVAALLLWSRG